MRYRLVFAALAAACALTPQLAAAQAYPAKTIRFIVPFAPGGGNDILGRVVAQKLNEAFGVPVVVDNRPGAGGTLGTDLTAKAPPDGYTMLINNLSVAVNVTLYSKLPFDPLKDLQTISLVGRQPNILVVHPTLPVTSWKALHALAKKHPGQLTFSSGGVGSSSHLAGELLKVVAGVDMVHVPYKGMGPALVDLISGQVQLSMSTMASALPHVRSKRMRPLAVSTAKRVAVVPDVPTLQEAGLRGYEHSTWYGLYVPAGTPRPAVDRLNETVRKVVASADVKKRFSPQGVEPASNSPDEFRAFLIAEIGKWAKVVKAAGLRAN
ncbi:MAG: tripartite tricarboxylate transporter substrate binding protein [Betaproteobacteria bacterium]|nr:tripartite tricarboxylate transporter substrate binding protein [Betaproteobacteria bacterium]